MVIERDSPAGNDAATKRLYTFSVAGLTPSAEPAVGDAAAFPVVEKALVRDLMADLQATGGATLEKIEGVAVVDDDTVLVVNDNDGVDDSSGETQLLELDDVFDDESAQWPKHRIALIDTGRSGV